MGAALAATLARPAWWAMALAAFLVRGGFLLILLPILSLPTTAGLTTAVAPALETLILGRQSLQGLLAGAVLITLLLAALTAALLAGSWLDLALMREAAEDEDVDLGWSPVHGSVREALALRLTAHLPTVVALGYAVLRLVPVAYEELTAPGETTAPVVTRVFERAPDALVLVVVAWLAGEAIGSLAARRSAVGMAATPALIASARQLFGPRGLATLALTSAVLVVLWLPFLLATQRAWAHLRADLLDGADAVQLSASLILLSATWVLGLAVAGAGLAWRATAWTAEVALPAGVDQPVAGTPPEVAPGAIRG
jgi:hypothetical protein